ncbi:hypothetical protein Pelo_2577 [Pelomyxa schiedti]|nr:hypothetical protein Pelo_2577 [Pelomyxa schiedti]
MGQIQARVVNSPMLGTLENKLIFGESTDRCGTSCYVSSGNISYQLSTICCNDEECSDPYPCCYFQCTCNITAYVDNCTSPKGLNGTGTTTVTTTYGHTSSTEYQTCGIPLDWCDYPYMCSSEIEDTDLVPGDSWDCWVDSEDSDIILYFWDQESRMTVVTLVGIGFFCAFILALTTVILITCCVDGYWTKLRGWKTVPEELPLSPLGSSTPDGYTLS